MEEQRSIEREIAGFKAYLTQKNRAENTVKVYAADIKNLIAPEVFGGLLNQTDFLTEAKYYTGLADLVEKEGKKVNPSLALKTQHRKICTANMFLKFLKETKKIKDYIPLGYAQLTGKKIELPELPTITEEEFERITAVISQKIKNKKHARCYDRDKAMYPLMFYTGAKPSEIHSIKLSDFKREPGQIVSVVLTNKDKRKREMPINESLAKDIDNYTIIYNETAEKRNKPALSEESIVFELSLRHIRRQLSIYAKEAGLEGIDPSYLRNSFAKKLIARGGDDKTLAERLGVLKGMVGVMKSAFS